MPAHILVGTSGWSYRHWRGVFYPADLPARQWLTYYSARFATVELNSTFYRTPRASSLRAWREQAPPGFVFALKANRFITHSKRLRDADETVARELEIVRPLGAARGPILFQLPPAMTRDLGRLAGLLEALPGDGAFAVEFRDGSWDDREVYAMLARRQVGVCLHDWHGHAWPRRAADEGAGPVYLRFHGPTGRYGGSYDRRTLRAWATRCERWREAGRDVFCYFNNDAEGNAVRDALALRRLLGERLSDETGLAA